MNDAASLARSIAAEIISIDSPDERWEAIKLSLHAIATRRTRATEAWAMMTREVETMPACIAIDFVQDLTDDRVLALKSILGVMGTWITDLCPEGGYQAEALRPGWRYRADVIAAQLGRQLNDDAERLIDSLKADTIEYEFNAAMWENPADSRVAREWREWCSHAARALAICRDLADAAPPVATGGVP